MLGSKKSISKRAVDTLITQNTKIEGNIGFTGVLYIDGQVIGDVSANDEGSVLTIGARGEVTGEIRVPHVVVYGAVKGDLYANEEVELLEKASVNGNVYYNLLQMTMGAEVNGKLVHRDPAQTQRLEHKPGSDVSNHSIEEQLNE